MQSFDYAILGSGVAGLSLAYQLVHSPLREQQILLIDCEPEDGNEHDWRFWTRRPTYFEPIYHRSWRKVGLQAKAFSRTFDLGEYRYNLLRGADLQPFVLRDLAVRPNLRLINTEIQQVQDAPQGVVITAGGQSYVAQWVFDGRSAPVSASRQPRRYHYLEQHVTGWEIQCEAEAFDPSRPVLFDFRAEQITCLRYFTVLPLTAQRAWVECASLSANPLPPEDDDACHLTEYLAGALGLPAYRVSARDRRVRTLTDQPFARRPGEHVLAIGARGGQVKPSTGDDFLRIQQDSASIIRSLELHASPFHIASTPARYQRFDSLWLHVLRHQPVQARRVLTRLFLNNPIQRVLAFLDESSGPADSWRVMAAAWPVGLFLATLAQTKLLRRV
jgi:lycopene beta-cyclase